MRRCVSRTLLLLPGPAEKVAGIDVAGIGVSGAEDDDDQLAAVAFAPGNEAGTGGGGCAGLYARIAVDRQQLVRVLPDDIAFVATFACYLRTVLTGADVL